MTRRAGDPNLRAKELIHPAALRGHLLFDRRAKLLVKADKVRIKLSYPGDPVQFVGQCADAIRETLRSASRARRSNLSGIRMFTRAMCGEGTKAQRATPRDLGCMILSSVA